jgi:hypothetical protein
MSCISEKYSESRIGIVDESSLCEYSVFHGLSGANHHSNPCFVDVPSSNGIQFEERMQ